jgi:hypothetical protein
MKKTLILLLLGAAIAAPAFADTVFTLQLLPGDGVVAGPPGSTVGWGYSITNNDDMEWLSLTGASSTLAFQYGTLNPLFDFPVVAPGSTVIQPWSSGSAGIFEFASDSGAPVGFSQSGLFTVTAEWFFQNPANSGCNFDDTSTSTCFDDFPTQDLAVASFTDVVGTEVAAPEPSSASLFFIAALLAGTCWHCRNSGWRAWRRRKEDLRAVR